MDARVLVQLRKQFLADVAFCNGVINVFGTRAAFSPNSTTNGVVIQVTRVLKLQKLS
jgi:hypothetical protein